MHPQWQFRISRLLFLWIGISILLRVSSTIGAPANDDFANATTFPGMVGQITNVTTFGSTLEANEPDPLLLAGAGSIWFRLNVSATTTGVVSVAGLSGTGFLSLFEWADSALVKLKAGSKVVSNRVEAGKSYYIQIQDNVSNSLSVSYFAPTLFLTKPSPFSGLTAPATFDCEITNIEEGASFSTIRVWGQTTNLAPAIVATGSQFPFSFRWTNQVAGQGALFVEAVTSDGLSRGSATNRTNFKNANDNFADATELDPGGGERLVCNFQTTRQAGEPHTELAGGAWYNWTPTASGKAQFDIGVTNSTPLYLIYQGDSETALTEVPLTSVPFTTVREADVVAGQTYRICTYGFTTLVRKFRYFVATVDFASPVVRSGLTSPGPIDLALTALPADATAVTYYYRSNVIVRVEAAPFSYHWNNTWPGNLDIVAVVERADGTSAYSRTIGLSVAVGNDTSATATILPADLLHLDLIGSTYLASNTSSTVAPGFSISEGAPGIWYKWTPSASGFLKIGSWDVPMGVGVADTFKYRYYSAASGPLTLQVGAGTNYYIVFAGTNTPDGFHWSIQNCPLLLINTNTNTFNEKQLVRFQPQLLGSVDIVDRVEFVDAGAGSLLATANNPPFAGEWQKLPGVYSVALRVMLKDGAILDGGKVSYAVSPANDDFETPAQLPGQATQLRIVEDVSTATVGPTESGDWYHSVWWTWTPEISGRVKVRVETPAQLITAIVGQWTSLTNSTVLDSDVWQGKGLQFDAVAGQTYRFVIAGLFNQPLVWTLDEETLTLNYSAPLITPATVRAVNALAGDHFERIDLLENGSVVASAGPPNFEFVLNDPGNYEVKLIGTNQNGFLRASWATNLVILPGNDAIASAIEIPGEVRIFNSTNRLANGTIEPGEPWRSDQSSLWWKWTPATGGRVTVTGVISGGTNWNFAATISTNLTQGINLAHRLLSGGFEFFVEPGVTYYLSIAGTPASTLSWKIELETLFLAISQQKPPIELRLIDTERAETFSEASILRDGLETIPLDAPNLTASWTTNQSGKYVFSAIGTNNLGEVRITRSVEYWVGPTNDFFANASWLDRAGNRLLGSGQLENCSVEQGELLFPGVVGTVWHRWTSGAYGSTEIAFSSGAADLLARSFLFEGDALFGLRQVATTMTNQSLWARMTKGHNYFFAVGSSNRTAETYSFTVIEPPPNDNLADSVELSGENAVFTGNAERATEEPGEQIVSAGVKASVWYRWTAQRTGNLTIRMDAVPGPVGMAVLYGTNFANAILHYPFVTATGPGTGILCRVIEGETYSFCVANANGSFNGHLEFAQISAPPNDFRRHEAPLAGTNIVVNGSTVNSTHELGEIGNGTLWWTWTAPVAGTVSFSIDGPQGGWPASMAYAISRGYTNSPGRFNVDEGQSVEFFLADPSYGVSFTMRLAEEEFRPPASNNSFENRSPIEGPNFLDHSTLYQAPVNIGPGFGYSHVVWYDLIPTGDGIALVELASVFPAEVRALVGSSFATLSSVTNGPSFQLKLTNGTPVHLVVGGNTAVNFDLHVYQVYGAPPNDQFQNAIQLAGTNALSFGHNFSATGQAGEPFLTKGKTVWWSWYAEDLGIAEARISAKFPFSARVYAGTKFGALTAIATVLSPDITNTLSFAAKANTIYQIQVDSMDGTQGLIDLQLVERILPIAINDNFAQRIAITNGWSTNRYSSKGATVQPSEPLFRAASTRTLWYEWRADLGGSTTLSASLGTAQLPIAVYQGDSLEALRFVAGSSTALTFLANAGETYKICVEFLSNQEGEFTLAIQSGKVWGNYPSATNLLKNGSFEDSLNEVSNWTLEVGPPPLDRSYVQGGAGFPDGNNELLLLYPLSQAIPMTTGKTYVLRMGLRAETGFTGPGQLEVLLNDRLLVAIAVPFDVGWVYPRYIFRAQSDTATLKLQMQGQNLQVDAVSIVELTESSSVGIGIQPLDANVPEGADTGFVVVPSGIPPNILQWYFHGQPIPGETNQVLHLPNVSPAAAGEYFVSVSNPKGATTSRTAILTVQPALAPSIAIQPEGQILSEQTFVSLVAIATGTEPIQCQWYKDGAALLGVTNRNLIIPSASIADSGVYFVTLQNRAGSLVSAEAKLKIVANPNLPIAIRTSNDLSTTVMDSSGARLSGSNFVAQLYVGASAETVRPIGIPLPFQRGFSAGLFGGSTLILPGGAGDYWVQFRAWDASRARTYEEARAAGAAFGGSLPAFVGPVGEGASISPSSQFALRPSIAGFTPGALQLIGPDSTDMLSIRLTGQPGFNYSIEKSGPAGWESVGFVTNANGNAELKVIAPSGNSSAVYRSRIID